jgi:hypothetical protein
MAKKPRFRPDYKGIGQLMRSQEVREELPPVAEGVRKRAKAIASAGGNPELGDSYRVETGTRPRGRPYARIITDHEGAVGAEYGDEGVDRLRVLGRAANVQVPE